MPYASRQELRGAAKVNRMRGETVTLLIAPIPSSNPTPFSIVSANAPSIKTAKTVVIYARVSYKPTQMSNDEGGRRTLVQAEIEADAAYGNFMAKCFAVKLLDGTTLTKTGEKISDTRTTFIIQCENWVNTPDSSTATQGE